MRLVSAVCAALAIGLIVSGCDWTASGQEGGWSSRYDTVNFSGVYRGPGGAAVASGVSLSEGGTLTVRGERVGDVVFGQSQYSGNLNNVPVVPGSVTINAAGVTFVDNGERALVSNNGSGTIVYNTGAWSIQSQAFDVGGGPITASYAYTTEGTGADTVRTLNVNHTGQRIRIEASTGAVFDGRIGGVNDQGGSIVVEFSASANHGGQRIRLVGVFQGAMATADGATTLTGNRTLNATWIEDGTGKSLDVNGISAAAAVDVTPVSP